MSEAAQNGANNIQTSEKVLVQFDLSLPLEPQLENATAALLSAKKKLEDVQAQVRGRDAGEVMQELGLGANKQ
jgi:hypothetical protein